MRTIRTVVDPLMLYAVTWLIGTAGEGVRRRQGARAFATDRQGLDRVRHPRTDSRSDARPDQRSGYCRREARSRSGPPAQGRPAAPRASHAGPSGPSGVGRRRGGFRRSRRRTGRSSDGRSARRAPGDEAGEAAIQVELTRTAERQLRNLHGRRLKAALDVLVALRARGCAVAGYRLAVAVLDHVCCRHLYGDDRSSPPGTRRITAS